MFRLLTRRACLTALAGASLSIAQQNRLNDVPPPEDWSCPMDPDYHSPKPGVCPRCGMKLVLLVPDRIEFPLEMSQSPELLLPGHTAALTFRIVNPASGAWVKQFETVHEKLIHLFVVHESLEFFAHVHPEFQLDGSFKISIKLPHPGMYRLLADFYPSGSTPQLALQTLFVAGDCRHEPLKAALDPCKSANLSATLKLDPPVPLAGFETKLHYTLDPADGLEPYLGAWGHMLAVSEDTIDMIHTHPFLANGGPSIQFNLLLPRPGMYRVWAQFQRQGVVDTTVFTIPAKAL